MIWGIVVFALMALLWHITVKMLEAKHSMEWQNEIATCKCPFPLHPPIAGDFCDACGAYYELR